jgi:predicted PurR-regulated permease PerM
MEQSRIQSAIFIGLFGVVVFFNILVFRPYFEILLIAIILAVLFKPVNQKIYKQIGNQGIAAFITTVIVFVLVLLPLVFYAQRIFIEAHAFYISLSNDSSNTFISTVVDKIKGLNNPTLTLDINQYLKNLSNSLLQNVGSIFSSVVKLIFTFIMILFSLYFFLKDGDRLRNFVIRLSPFPKEADTKVFEKMEATINSVIRGQMLVAILHGIIAIIGFSIFGVPNPILWGSTVVIAALVPPIGVSLVVVPVIAYLYFSGQIGATVGLSIWEAIAMGILDNFIGPMIINRNLKIHPFVILLSIIGAISVFGPIGFVLGPLILTLLVALFEVRYVLIKK